MGVVASEIEVVTGKADAIDNVLKHAPHTAAAVSADNWPHAYSREKAAYPLPLVRPTSFGQAWVASTIRMAIRNLVCI